MNQENKIEDWKGQLDVLIGKETGSTKIIIDFVEKLIDQVGREEYQKGFNDGADSAGRQAQEIMALEINEAKMEERERIYKDLILMADQGELEELRREVERYFKGLDK